MILNRLRATNVLKYARLELNGIPDKGQIAITGPNESGKTAIVESICFALFGRTFSRGPEEITHIIRWGESSCDIELVFTGNSNKTYALQRSVDTHGVHSAELREINVKEPFAVGPHSVRDAIIGICGFDYPQYLDALYLAQLEISAPHSQSDTIKEIAGTTELEAVAEELEQEIAAERAAIRRLESEISDLEGQIALLNIDRDSLQRIEQEQQTTQAEIRDNEDKIVRFEDVSEELEQIAATLTDLGADFSQVTTSHAFKDWAGYGSQFGAMADRFAVACDSVEDGGALCEEGGPIEDLSDLNARLAQFEPVQRKLHVYRSELAARLGSDSRESAQAGQKVALPRLIKAENRRLAVARVNSGIGQSWFLLFVIAVAVAWLVWWFAQPAGGLAQSWATENISWWKPDYFSWVLPVTITLSIFTALTLVWPIKAESRVTRIRARISDLEKELSEVQTQVALIDGLETQPLPEVDEYLSELEPHGIGEAWQSFAEDDGAIFLDQSMLEEYKGEVAESVRTIGTEAVNFRQAIAMRIGGLRQAIQDRRERLDNYAREIADVQRRQEKLNELQETINHLSPRCNQHTENIGLRELAVQLTRDTCRHIYDRFNGVLSKYTSEVMPKLTEGRYSQMQIDDDLNIRVFSNAKNDFGQLNEFSSGTQRQMMLAVRLAMARALVEATDQRKQFLILDEPFAFFDRERIDNTLTALPHVDKRMSQIWLISQEFESYAPFKLQIECARDGDELVVG